MPARGRVALRFVRFGPVPPQRSQIEAVSLATGERRVVVEDAADARYVPTGHLVFARRGVLRMTVKEQQSADSPRRMSGVLWDLFSGSASYTDVFLRTLHPAFLGRLAWSLGRAVLPGGQQTTR